MENQPVILGDPSRSSERELNVVRRFMCGAWDHDPNLITKFFPIDAHTRKVYQSAEKLRYHNRWKGIPRKEPKSPSTLYFPLTHLLTDILHCFGLYEDTRRLINTSKTLVYPNLTYPTWPPLLLAGSGKYFCTPVTRPLPDYGLGISPMEVRLESQDETVARDRLAVNVQQMFLYQFNRRYAFGVVISQQTLTVHMFDRSGAVSSPSLDYHAHPIQFCAIISGLASMQATRLGMDTSIYFDAEGRLRTKEAREGRKTKDVVYTLLTTLYYAPDFVGRGTICFVAYEEAAPQKKFVIKDTWIAEEEMKGRESEASLLLLAERRGLTVGVARVRHSEEVQVKGPTDRIGIDSVLRNRQSSSLSRPKVERVHTRIIMTPYGKPLDCFSNRKELLIAYHDALQAHRKLHDIAGILHRDIKPENILINPHGIEGDHGVLIDFDHAIRTDDTSPYSTKRQIGTYLFMSRNALEGNEPQTCLDDLESFYYVLVYIVLMFSGPHSTVEKLNPLLDRWRRPLAHNAKKGFLLFPMEEEVEPWFGDPFKNLVNRLHSIFKSHILQCALAEGNGKPPPVLYSAQVYDDFLTHVRQAITEIDLEEASIHLASPADDISDNPRKRTFAISNGEHDEQSSQVYSWVHAGPHNDGVLGVPTTAAASRSLRSSARITKTLRNRADNPDANKRSRKK